MEVPDWTEAMALIRAASQGDAAALARLLPLVELELRRELRNRSWALSADEVDDLTQEALIRVVEWLHAVRAESIGEFRAWLRRIASTVLYDFEVREEWNARRISIEDVPVAIAMTSEREAPVPTPATAKRIAVLLGALRELPESTQTLIWMHVVWGASWKELAEHSGLSLSGAKRRFQRALARIRRLVK